MPRTSSNHHLYLNHHTWNFRFRWPEDVRSGIDGKHEFHKSLQTSVLQEALHGRDTLLVNCKNMVQTIRAGNTQEIEKLRNRLFVEGVVFGDNISTNLDKVQTSRSGLNIEAVSEALRQIFDVGGGSATKEGKKLPNPKETNKIIGGLEQVEDLMRLVIETRAAISFDDYLQEWLDKRRSQVTKKSLDEGRLSVMIFKESFPTLGSVRRRHVKQWFDNQITTYSPDRLNKLKQHLQAYWNFLKRGVNHIIIDEDSEPFRDIVINKHSNKSKQTNRWLPFPNLGQDIVQLLNDAVAKRDQQLINLIILDMYTGMRIEEACSLTIKHIHRDYIFVAESKNTAGIRKIPIHSVLAEPLEMMVRESTDGFVISGLNSKNKYGIRSDPIGKRFGRLKSKRGFGPNHVFHSIRETFIAMLEQKNVIESTTADIVGHSKKNYIYRGYEGGATMEDKKEAIEKLAYPLENL